MESLAKYPIRQGGAAAPASRRKNFLPPLLRDASSRSSVRRRRAMAAVCLLCDGKRRRLNIASIWALGSVMSQAHMAYTSKSLTLTSHDTLSPALVNSSFISSGAAAAPPSLPNPSQQIAAPLQGEEEVVGACPGVAAAGRGRGRGHGRGAPPVAEPFCAARDGIGRGQGQGTPAPNGSSSTFLVLKLQQ